MKEHKINVDLVRQGLISLKDYEELPHDFKIRNNLNFRKALRIVKIDHRMDNRFADVTVREVEATKPEVNMPKRKLKIPEEVPKEYMCHPDLLVIDGMEVEFICVMTTDGIARFKYMGKDFHCPESWLIPIEEKVITAEEYVNDQYSPETKHFERHQIELAFNEGERNQRLKMDEKLKPIEEIIREEIENIVSQFCDGTFNGLKDAHFIEYGEAYRPDKLVDKLMEFFQHTT